MSGFKEGSLQLRKKDVSTAADQNHLKILVDTNNNLYTVDEFGVYRAVAGYDVQVSGTALNLVTSGATKIISLNDSGVTSGSYGGPTIVAAFTVGSDGRIISATNVPISATGLGTVTSIGINSNSLSVSSSPITTSGNIIVNLSAIGTSGIFTKIVKDVYGRVTSGGYIGATDILDRSTDGTLSANSDNKIPTEQAVKTYVDENDKRNSVGVADAVCYDIIDNGDGTATVLPQTVYIFDNPDFLGNIKKYSVSGNTFTLTDGIEQHICVKYNSGNPIYYVENDMNAINESDVICVHIVWRVGNTIHSINRDSKGLGLSNKIAKSILKTKPYSISMDGGLILSETSSPTNRTILITSAVVYSGIVPVSVLSFTSVSDKLTLAYHNTGNWTYSSGTTYNNTQYDDGFTLQTIPNNKYAVRWFYRSIGDIKETFYVLGNDHYHNIEEAKLEAPRNDLPLVIRRHCVLVGRIIIQYNASSGYVENVTDINFANTSVPNHNDLNNIQGGGAGEYYHLSASTYSYLSGVTSDIQTQLDSKMTSAILDVLKEPTGFPRIDNTSLLFNNSTRIFTLSALSGNYDVYFRGRKFTKTTETIQIPALSGLHFIYFNSSGTISTSQTPWVIEDTIQIALVYWNGVSALSLGEERHGCVMDCATHAYLHKTQKTQYVDGFDASYTLTNTSNVTIGLTEGRIADEDLELYIRNGSINNYLTQPINSSAYIPVYYRQGTDGNGTWKKDTATVYPFKNNGAGTNVNYNQLSAGNWIQTPVTNKYYVCYFIYATDNIYEPIIAVQGQRQDSDITDARNNASPLNLLFSDFPVVEGKLLYRLICRVSVLYLQNPYNIRIDDVTDYRTVGITVGGNAGGTGTVTYVGLSANPIMTISGTPITNAGTFTIDYASQLSGTFFSGPTSGSNSIPTFRRIVSADIPNLSNIYYPVSSTGNISGLTSPAQTQLNNLSANYTTRTEVSGVSANLQNQITNNNNSLSGYLPLSGGTLSGQLKGTTISASGNISGSNFVGNLQGYKNVDNTNECTISNGYSATGNLFINYRGATSAINQYRFWNGRAGSGDYSSILASAFVKNGGTSTQFLKADGSSDSNSYTTTQTVSSISGTLQNQITSISSNYTTRTEVSGVSANIRNSLSAYLPLSGGTLTGQLRGTTISASGNISATSFVKIGGTSAQFLKADGSVDSNSYTTTQTVSSISGTLQNQITNNNNSLSAYLPLSGGTLTGQLNAKYISADGGFLVRFDGPNIHQIYRPTSSVTTTFGQTFEANNNAGQKVIYSRIINSIDSAVSGLHTGSIYFKIYKNGVEQTPVQILDNQLKVVGTVSASGNIIAPQFNGVLEGSKNVEFGNETNIANGFSSTQSLFINYRGATSSINEYRFWNGRAGAGAYSSLFASAYKVNGGTSAQFLMGDGSLSTGDFLSNKFLPLSGGTMFGNILFSDPGNGNYRGISGANGGSDLWGIRGYASTTNNGSLEIYTGDDGNEPIYVTQYGATTPVNQIILLNSIGNTYFPKTVFSNGFNGDLSATNVNSTNVYFSGVLNNPGFAGNKVVVTDGSKNIVESTASSTEASYLVGVSANIQTQINQLLQNSISGTGTGTVNYISKFITTSSVGNSNIYDSGSLVSIYSALSASGNITAPQFNGNLNGYKNVDNTNECTISNGYVDNSGLLYINYRGATSSINEYRFWNGRSGSGAYSNVRANGFVKNGGTSTQYLMADGSVSYSDSLSNKFLPLSGGTLTRNLKISAYNEGWSEGLRVMVPVNNWGGLRLSRNSLTASTEDNWAIGYANNSTGNLEYDVYTGGSQIKHTIFYKNLGIYTLGNVSAAEFRIRNSAILTSGSNANNIRVRGTINPTRGFIEFGTGTAYFGYNDSFDEFILKGNFNPDADVAYDIGNTVSYWNRIYANSYIKKGGTSTQYLMADGSVSYSDSLSNKFLPLSGGTLTRNLKISAYPEDWSEGLKIMTAPGFWGGIRLTRDNTNLAAEDNWAIGYANNSTGNLEYDVYTGGSQLKHTIFYKNGSVYHLGNISASELRIRNSAIITSGDTLDSIRIFGGSDSTLGYIVYGNNNAAFGYDGYEFTSNRTIIPSSPADYDLGSSSFYWNRVYANRFIVPGGTNVQFLMADGTISYGDHLFNKFLPLSGGTMTGAIYGNSFKSGWVAMLSNDGKANFDKVTIAKQISDSNTELLIAENCYIGAMWADPSYARFYNSSSGKTNTLIVSNGNNDGYGGICFGGPNRSSIGSRGLTSPLELYSDTGLSLASAKISDYITYTTAVDSGGSLPDGYTYYEIQSNGDTYLPDPIPTKVIYVYSSVTLAYIKPQGSTTVWYSNYSGTNKSCDSTQKILIPQNRTIMLIGNNSNQYSIIGPALDPV